MTIGKILFPFLIFTLSCNDFDKENYSPFRDFDKIKSEAEEAYERNDYRNAILLYNELINLDSSKGEYYFKRGYSYSMLFNVEQAVQDYKKSIDRGHRAGHAYNNIGVNYSTIDDSLAIVYFQKALKLDSTNDKIIRRIRECEKRLNEANKQFVK